MKPLLLVLSLLLLALLVSRAGHGAHHGLHMRPAAAQPLRVVRSPAVARQHRLVRAIKNAKNVEL